MSAYRNTVVKILRRTRDLIKEESSWIKGFPAVDKSGNDVKPTDPEACRWCLTGAVTYALHEGIVDGNVITNSLWSTFTLRGSVYRKIADVLREENSKRLDLSGFNSQGIVGFNDYPETTHSEILDLLDKTIHHAQEDIR